MTNSQNVVYPILRLLKFGNIFGMSPYGRKQIKNLNQPRLGFVNLMLSLLVSTTMLVSYGILLTLQETSTRSKAHRLHAIVNGFRVVGAALTILLTLSKQNDFVECLRRIHSFDKTMETLGAPPSYIKHRFFILLGCVFITFSQICVSFLLWSSKKSLSLTVCYFLSQGYQFLVIGIIVIHVNYFCFVSRAKLNFIINTTKTLGKNNRDPLEILIMISEMYTHVYQATRHINCMVSIPVLILTVSGILGGLTTLNLIYHAEDSCVDLVSLGLYVLQIIWTLLPPMFIKKKPNMITRILGECVICYEDKKLAKAKDTFLYQVLQQRIELTVCGLFPMSMSALSEQIGLCISLIFFLNQIVQ